VTGTSTGTGAGTGLDSYRSHCDSLLVGSRRESRTHTRAPIVDRSHRRVGQGHRTDTPPPRRNTARTPTYPKPQLRPSPFHRTEAVFL
jgi:hypothetical protein